MGKQIQTQFGDRSEAGQKLAKLLGKKNIINPYILGLSRGGIPVAFEVAKKLRAPLDVLVVRKLRVPGQEELGFGAIAPGGKIIVDNQTVKNHGLTNEQIEVIERNERQELLRRTILYRGDTPYPDLTNFSVVLVDDGMATGGTALAAVEFVKTLNPADIFLVVPVSPLRTAINLGKKVKMIVLHAATGVFSVGQCYKNFPQVTDNEVVELLHSNHK